MGRLAGLREHLRQLGAVDGSLYLANAVLRRATGGRSHIIKYDLMVQPVRREPLLPPHRGGNIRIHEAGREDPLLTEAASRPVETLHTRFDAGARCLVASIDGEFAGFLWFQDGDYAEDEVRCIFRPEPPGAAVWDFDVYVAPRHRLSPVFLKLWDEANRRLQADGVSHACSRISAFNAASRAAHGRLGAVRAGWALFVCIGWCQFASASSGPVLHASGAGASRPLIRVPPPAGKD